MNNEQDSVATDELVSGTYRDLGVERAPEPLNQAILKMATDEFEHRGASKPPFAAWMKPVAWAATFALTLAIVLEIADLPGAAEPTIEEVVVEDVASSSPKMKREVIAAPAAAPLRSAQPIARKPAADRPVVIEQPAAFAISAEGMTFELVTACDESARQSAEDWLECIEVLRESGAVEAADLEYEAFILEYPVASVETETNR